MDIYVWQKSAKETEYLKVGRHLARWSVEIRLVGTSWWRISREKI